MKQNQYEAILSCIQYGAPAMAKTLADAFNEVIQNSNEFLSQKIKAQEEAKKATDKETRETKNQK